MLQNILLRIVLFCQLLKSNAVLRSALIRYSLEFGTLTASFSTKNSACNSVYLQAMTDSDNNHFFLQNFHRLEFPIAIPCVHSDNQNVLLLMMIPCSDWNDVLLIVPESTRYQSPLLTRNTVTRTERCFSWTQSPWHDQVYSIILPFQVVTIWGLMFFRPCIIV